MTHYDRAGTEDCSGVPTAKLVEVELKTRTELANELFQDQIRSEKEHRAATKARGSVRSGVDTM